MTAWIGASFNYEVPEKVYTWLGAFAYEFFVEQAVIAILLFITPLWNKNWDAIQFGSAEFMYVWLMFVPFIIMQVEHDMDQFIDFG